MAARLSLKALVRDGCMMLVGVLLGFLLTQMFIGNPMRNIAELCNSERVAHITKRFSSSQSNNLYKHEARKKGSLQQRTSKSHNTTRFNNRRPKTLTEELFYTTVRKPLFIGVITAHSLLGTRAMAVSQTWGAKAPKLMFFSSTKGKRDFSWQLPVVSLPGVDDSYPPQKKVYRMLKYMHDHYIHDFDWFMRADDDVYVRIEHLVHFLSKLDPNKELYIGQPGSGKASDRERIKLLPHKHYCMGGPGVIFSRALLSKLGPHLDDCLKNVVVTWNEDLEVGRCISRWLGVQCTWNHEMGQLFLNDYSKGEIFKTSDVYKSKRLPNALTVHSFKEPQMMFRIHQYYLELAVNNSQLRTQMLQNELSNVAKITGRNRAFA